MILSKFIFSWIVFFGIWLIFTASLAYDELLTGAAITLLIALFYAKFYSKRYSSYGLRYFSPKRLFYILLYLLVFLRELFFSTLNVARIVMTPSLPINPGIVKFKTKLTSNVAKMLLANSITLTPGTLTVDIAEDVFYIHWLDVKTEEPEEAYTQIAETFESILRKIYQ